MTAATSAFLESNSVRAFSSPQVIPVSISQSEDSSTDRHQHYSMYPISMRQSVGFAGETDRVQRPSKRVRSEFMVRGREASDSEISLSKTEQQPHS